MSESFNPPLQVRAVLRCRNAAAPALHSEAAARWLLGHVAFNSGFEQRPVPGGQWSRYRTNRHVVAPGFELGLDMRDGRFELRSTPSQRRLELQVLLGPGARHLRRNLPRLVEDLAAACMAEVVSFEFPDTRIVSSSPRPEAEPLVLPA